MNDGANAAIDVRDVTKTYALGDVEGRSAARRDVHDRPRRVRRDHGPVGLRQVDADEPAGLPRPADRRRVLPRRHRRLHAERRRAGGDQAARSWASSSRDSTCSARTSALKNVALPLFYAGVGNARAQRRRDRAARARSASATGSTTSPANSRAGSSSGSRSRARWSTIPRCCSPTSRPATSTPRPAKRSWRSSASSTPAAARSSWSPTTRTSPATPSGSSALRDGRIVSDEPTARG